MNGSLVSSSQNTEQHFEQNVAQGENEAQKCVLPQHRMEGWLFPGAGGGLWGAKTEKGPGEAS